MPALFLSAVALAAAAPTCNGNAKYVVISQANEGGVGSKILVKADPQAPCVWAPAPGDFQVPAGDAEYYLALTGDYLLTDSGTGPSGRTLTIYSLTSKNKLWSGAYAGPVTYDNVGVTFWQPSDVVASAANCPTFVQDKANGLGDAIEQQVKVALPSLAQTPTGQTRCTATQ